MDGMLRVLAVLVLLVPLQIMACVEGTEIQVREVRVDGGMSSGSVDEEDRAVRGGSDQPRMSLDNLMRMGRPDAADGVDLDDGWNPDEEYAFSEYDFGGAVELVVDENAPSVEVLSLERREGSEGHYLSLVCHDATPGLPSRWNGWNQPRVSRECEVELATTLRAISISPAVDFRIAPTPQGVRILGNFRQGDYEVRIAPGLRTEGGAILKEESHHSVTIPALSPSVSFTASGRYLPRLAWEELTFRHRNVDEVEITVRHVPRQNLPFWLSNTTENVDQRTSNVVVQTQMAVRNEEDQTLTTTLSIDEHLGDPEPGLYQITATGGGQTATARLQVTDINLIAKRHEAAPDSPWPTAIDVWAVDMETTEPISGVAMEVIRPSGATMARCRSDRNGHCQLSLPQEATDSAQPMAILARSGDDLTYLRFADVRTELSGGEVHGRPYLEEITYHAALYGDRDLYRPGDTFHLVGALRDVDYSAVDAGIPAQVIVRDPQGKVVVERNMQTGVAGLVDLSFRINEVAPTGRWRAELEVGTRRIATYSFHVEEFVPERLEVSARATSPRFVVGEEFNFDVSARYLFGAGAEGSEVEVQCRLVPMETAAVGGDRYRFGPLEIEERRQVIDLPTRNGVIDEDDRATIACAQAEEALGGPFRLEATVAVSEAGSGRATRAQAIAEVYPSPVQVGLRSRSDSLAQGDTFSVEGVLIDLDGESVTEIDEDVTLEFYNLRRQSSRFYDQTTGRHTWRSDYQLILERVVDVTPRDGRFRFETTAADVHSGYLVRARFGDSRTDMQIDRRGSHWNWNVPTDQTPRPLRPTAVRMEVPDVASLSGPTEIRFVAPYPGRTLLTVETDRVIEQAWVQAEAGLNTWSFELDEHVPNIYVSAFIIRNPRHASPDSFTPERAFGAASITVERTPLEVPVELRIEEEVRPGEILEVELAVGTTVGPVMATIAAVDEGILQLTNYRTPNPLDSILSRRALGVETFDTVGWATQLPPSGSSSRTGGGDYYEEEQASGGRILPFRPVALWSGLVEVGEDGRAVVEFEVPNYRGRLRVMAAVFGAEEMGSAQGSVLIRDPLTVQTTFPRFLTIGDEVQVPVFVANLTDSDRRVEVEINASEYDLPGFDVAPEESGQAILEFLDGQLREVDVEAGGSETVYFTVRSIRPGGAASMSVRAESGELLSFDEGMIPLRAGGPTERRVETIALNNLEGGVLDLSRYLQGWVPTSEQTTLWISHMSQPETFDHLEYLVRYPFGCAEQTISSARPLLFVSQFVEAVDPGSVAESGGIESMVEYGINRILSMQGPSGAFSYWPGASWYSTWVTAYALHFLMDAAEQGYAVPDSRLTDATRWLRENVDESPQSAYSHYVLAIAGEAQAGPIRRAINGLPNHARGQDAEQAYLLYAALYLSGDRSFEEELRNVAIDTDQGGRSSGWGFYSHRRRRAMQLNIFVDLFGQDEDGQALVDAVTSDLSNRDRPYWTTQELVWGITGLGKWYQRDGADLARVALSLNGQEVEPRHHVQGLPAWSVARASEFDQVRLTIDRLDEEAELFALLTSEGIREEPNVRYGGQGLAVERNYLNRRGEKLAADEVALGELVYVRVRVRNRSGRDLRHVALVDRLPAGLEVENPDLGSAALPSWASTTWNVDHSNTRDDRVELFGTINRGATVDVVYAARATMSGHFHVPSLEAEAMYEPEVWARQRGAQFRVSAPWLALID